MKNPFILNSINIEDIGADGVSIAKKDGMVILVNGGVPGDIVDIYIFKKKRNYLEGRVINIVQPSEHRIEPFCEYFGKCGGCIWQNINYQAQLNFKQNQADASLQRIANVEFRNNEPIISAEIQQFYRNKLEFSFSNNVFPFNKENNNPKALGFHPKGKFNSVVDIHKCYLQQEPSNELRNFIRKFAVENNYDFFDIKGNNGFLRTLIIRTTRTGQAMIVIAFFNNDKDKINSLLDAIIKEFPTINSVNYVINGKMNDTIFDLEVINYFGNDYILEEILGCKFKITAKSFFQTNTFQTEKLYELAIRFADFKGDELVYDLYSGVGSISCILASKVKKVVAIEEVTEAVKISKENAVLNGLNNIDFITSKVENILNTEFANNYGFADVIFLDPPRNGLHTKVIEELIKFGANKIVYISCNHSTQARDIALLKEHYQLIKYQVVDMFPNTYHLETVALLEKIK